jgi:Protein NO VEIN, C-terminal
VPLSDEPLVIVTRPEEFNRLLILLAEHGEADGLSREAILSIVSSATFHAQLPSHEQTLLGATQLGFVGVSNRRYALTGLGRSFVALNPECTYELAPGQSRFLLDHCVLEGGYFALARELFALFQPRGLRRVLALDLWNGRVNEEMHLLIALLRRLGVLVVQGKMAVVRVDHASVASALRAKEKISLAELEALLEIRLAQGLAAESWVLEHERTRLRDAGCEIEARAVCIVSETDVAAGYDIESFDGLSEDLTPDRFIEVKSAAGAALTFIWSRNEYAKAVELGDRYWIYHLRSFVLPLVSPPSLSTIQNPAKLCARGEVLLTPAAYEAEVK